MNVNVGSELDITDMSSLELNKLDIFLKSKLVIDNPQYYRLQKMGKWVGNTPAHIFLYSKIKNGFLVPFGSLKYIYNMFKDADYNLNFKKHDSIEFNSTIKPYDYQRYAIDKAIKAKNGILVAPCGAGKTEMALQIIAEIGIPALWITHTQDLLEQSLNRAKNNYKIPSDCFGTITAGKINIGSHITFATVQTLCKVDLKKMKDEFGIILVDECHRVGGSPTNVMMFYKCLSNLSARYKIGVTATPKKNGLEQSMYSLFGDLIYEIPKEVVESKLCPVEVVTVDTKYCPSTDDILETDGTINSNKAVNCLCSNRERNDLIIDIVKDKKNCIVLSERVVHLEHLASKVPNRNVCVLTSKTKNRKEILENFKTGKIDVLFSTYQLMAEGFDCPTLKYLIFATPQKNERIITQSCGRVARKCDGKDKGVIYDLNDNFFLYKNMRKSREKIYKKNNYTF